MHWHVNYNLPEVEGSFGANNRDVSQEMHAEVGYAHADVSKVELVVWPWRNNPKWGPVPSTMSTSTSSGFKNITDGSVEGSGSTSDGYASGDDSEEAGKRALVIRSTKGALRKKDWVGQGLADLQEHIADLQEWWETKQNTQESAAATSAAPPQTAVATSSAPDVGSIVSSARSNLEHAINSVFKSNISD